MKDPLIISELKRIAAKNNGVLLPSQVVEAASEETSPLHNQFEWDDSEAAQKYRLWQARQLINVTVEMVQFDSEKAVSTRVFVSLRPDREDGGYRQLTTVLCDKDLRAQLLNDAFEEMQHFKRKYKQLQELDEVFSAMSTAEKRLLKKTAAA